MKQHDELSDLGKRLDALKPKPAASSASEDASATGKALQMGTEFIAGVGVGGVLGYFLDRWLDTSPIFLMVCLVLGLAAGYRNLLRMVRNDPEAGLNAGPITNDEEDEK